VDWETTRCLAAATQTDLGYARSVVRLIVGERFRAVAPASGVDVMVVTRWALAALRRRAWRDFTLTSALMLGILLIVLTGYWWPVVPMLACAVAAVAYERWVRDERVLARTMLRGRFRGADSPEPISGRVHARLAVVEAEQRGDVIVFPGEKAFVGSGRRVIHDRVLIQAALGKRNKEGSRAIPKSFTNAELHTALEDALRHMGFPELHVGERLYVNGKHVSADSRLLPNPLAPPVAVAPAGLLQESCEHPTADARTYLCAEIRGWKGQLVVSLFARAVQARGSLQVEWGFQVLPPLKDHFLYIDQRYQIHPCLQFVKAIGTGVIWCIPELITSPFNFARYAWSPVRDARRERWQAYAISRGFVFNYGSLHSIRENAVGNRMLHYFLLQDELTFILLAEHTMFRALGNFLEAHDVDMTQFEAQEKTFVNNISNYNINEVNGKNFAIGDHTRVTVSK